MTATIKGALNGAGMSASSSQSATATNFTDDSSTRPKQANDIRVSAFGELFSGASANSTSSCACDNAKTSESARVQNGDAIDFASPQLLLL